MVSIDLGVCHSRFLIVFQPANDSSLIFCFSQHVLDSWRFEPEPRSIHKILLAGGRVPDARAEIPGEGTTSNHRSSYIRRVYNASNGVSVDEHERFTPFVNSAVL